VPAFRLLEQPGFSGGEQEDVCFVSTYHAVC